MIGWAERPGIVGWLGRRAFTLNGIKRHAITATRVLRSGLFDGAWYLRQRPNLAGTYWPALVHYIFTGCHSDPSRDFCAQEYLYLNPDVARAGIPALLHYERYGRRAGRLVSLLETGKEIAFPEGTAAFTVDFGIQPPKKRRTAVFASYSGNGLIEPHVLYYLRGLKEVCDNIVFVTDNPLFKAEQNKLQGVVSCMLVARHGEYDFGSYRRGWEWAVQKGILEESDELVFCNDSCYGPFHPFTGVFDKMSRSKCDFWGLAMFATGNNNLEKASFHFQSFFLAFRHNVFNSDVFIDFMHNIRRLPEPARENVIAEYEFKLTPLLEQAGFKWESLTPYDFCLTHKSVPTNRPATTMLKYGMPLLKIKMYGESPHAESPAKALRVAKHLNPDLYCDLLPHYLDRMEAFKCRIKTRCLPAVDFTQHQLSFQNKLAIVGARIKNDEAIRVTFLVASSAMFPSRPLFEAMVQDPLFAPRIVVITELTLVNDTSQAERALKRLQAELPQAVILPAWTGDEVTPWYDISLDSDLVVYNSPYANSHFFYNPRFSYGRSFLPIHVNYGYYRSIYDRHVMAMDTYAYFWMAFFENEAVLEEYKRYSVLKGSNGVLTGYIKMDGLAEKQRRESSRKCILIAPHHSVDGGVNRVLGLSNFVRYAELFIELPERYPDIDFIFRPHPALFPVLSREKFWGEERVAEWCERMRSYSNVTWSDGGDYFQEFVDSDAIIQDCGSFLVEYLYTGKPCCYMLKSPRDIKSKFTPFGQECLEQCYLAYDASTIERFIDEVVIGGNDPLAGAREKFRHCILYTSDDADEG